MYNYVILHNFFFLCMFQIIIIIYKHISHFLILIRLLAINFFKNYFKENYFITHFSYEIIKTQKLASIMNSHVKYTHNNLFTLKKIQHKILI